jgi:hypothetical protein
MRIVFKLILNTKKEKINPNNLFKMVILYILEAIILVMIQTVVAKTVPTTQLWPDFFIKFTSVIIFNMTKYIYL